MVLWPHPFIPKASSKLKQQRETFYRCSHVSCKSRRSLLTFSPSFFVFLSPPTDIAGCYLFNPVSNEVTTRNILLLFHVPWKKLSPVEECFFKFLNDSCTALRPRNTRYFVTNGHRVLRGRRAVQESEVHWSKDSGDRY